MVITGNLLLGHFHAPVYPENQQNYIENAAICFETINNHIYSEHTKRVQIYMFIYLH